MRKETTDSDRLDEENASASAIEVASAADRFSHVKTVGEFTTRIKAAWHKSVAGIIEAGELWDKAKSRLSRVELKELKRNTKFSDPTISMLTSIANDTRITDPKYRAVLPSSYGTLYALTHLSDAEFESAFNDGVLRPDIEREAVMMLRGKQHSDRAKAMAKGTVLFRVLLSQNEIDPSDLQLLKSVVNSLLGRPSVTVEVSPAWKRLLKEAK
jgi:hypothetical protein